MRVYSCPLEVLLAIHPHVLMAPHQAINNQNPLVYTIYSVAEVHHIASTRQRYPLGYDSVLTLRALQVRHPSTVRSGDSECRLLTRLTPLLWNLARLSISATP
jgi:hypothetical protein